jgi:hypothetical protein
MAKQELGELYYKITGDTTNLDKGLTTSDKKVSTLGKSFTGFGKIVTAAIAVVAVAGVTKLSKSLILAASEAEETRQKFSVVFSKVAEDATASAKEIADSYGLSQTASEKFLAQVGDITSGLGATSEQALFAAETITKLGVDTASFANLSGGAEQAVSALTSLFTGEREAAKALGIVINETNLKQYAEDTGLVYSELTQLEKGFLSLELAAQQSALSVGDFARSQSSFANQSRIAQARIEDLKVSLGNNLLPIANVGVSIFNDFAKQALFVAESIGDFVSSAEGADKIGTIIGEISAGVSVLGALGKPIFEELGGAILDIVSPFEDLLSVTGNTTGQFKVFGAVSATIAGVIGLVGNSVGATISNLIAMGKTFTAVGDLGATFWQVMAGEASIKDLKNQAINAGETFANLGKTVISSNADVFTGLKDFATGYQDQLNEAAKAADVAFTTTGDIIKNKVTTALTEAGETSTETKDKIVEDNLEIADSYDLNAERLRALQDEFGTLEEIEKAWSEGALQRQVELVNVGVGSLLSSFGDLGEAFVAGELGWDSFAKAGLNAIAAVLDALGAQLAAQAAALIGAAFFTAGASLSGLAPVLAGSATAFAAAGVVRGIAGSFEQGGVVPTIPGVPATGDKQLIAVNGGETVTPADESSGGVTQFVFQMDGKIISDMVVDNYINKGRNLISLKRGTRA